MEEWIHANYILVFSEQFLKADWWTMNIVHRVNAGRVVCRAQGYRSMQSSEVHAKWEGRMNQGSLCYTHIYIYVLNKQRLPITVLKIDQTVKPDLSIKAVDVFFQNISWNIFTESLYKSLMTVAIALSQKIECNMKSSSKQGLDKYIYHWLPMIWEELR